MKHAGNMHASLPSSGLGIAIQPCAFQAIGKGQSNQRHIPSDGAAASSCPPFRDRSISPIGTVDYIGHKSTLSASSSRSADGHMAVRSFLGIESQRLAANGDGMVACQVGNDCSGIEGGGRSALDPIMPEGDIITQNHRHGSHNALASRLLPTSRTILNIGSATVRNAAELRVLLGNSNSRLKPKAVMLPSPRTHLASKRINASDTISLEQAKHRARVEVDIVLESETCVQGGYLRGHIKIRVRKRSKREAPVLLAEGKLRVVGFETIPNGDDYHTFYQCAAPISMITDASQSLYNSPPDLEGYAQAMEGVHVLPFAMELSLNSPFGSAKGVFNSNPGLSVRYVAMVSVKVKDAETERRSIAHFYRNCEIWPCLISKSILTPAPRPLQATTAKSLSILGGSATEKVRLTANLHRLHWVAGQRCYIRVRVHNGSKKAIKSLVLGLIRTITIFKPRPTLNGGYEPNPDPDACQTSTTHKLITETRLEMSQRGSRGHASAKGWWTGVKPGQDLEFSHFILLPPSALSITRGRLLEVEYSIRVSLNAGPLTSDVFVTLPIRIINFISIDPPPSRGLLSPNGAYSRGVKHHSPQLSSSSELSSGPYRATPANSTAGHARYPASSSINEYDPSEAPHNARPRHSTFVPSDSYMSPPLQVTNPDPAPTESEASFAQSNSQMRIAIQRSLSDVSVYSTDSDDGVLNAASSGSFESQRNGKHRRLGNLDCPSDVDDSEAELAYVMNSVKLEQQETAFSESEDEENIEKSRPDHSGEDYSLLRSSIESYDDSDLVRDSDKRQQCRMTLDLEDISPTNFALRVQEKLVARVQKTDKVLPTPLEYEPDMDEKTPRIRYNGPTEPHNLKPTHDLTIPPQTASVSSNHRRVPSSVRGPRGSRVLPKPPTHNSSSSASNREDAHARVGSSLNVSQIQNETRPPPASMKQTGESSSSVKNMIAALEERVKSSQSGGDAFI